MAIKLNDEDLQCFALDNEFAVLNIQNQNFVMDYSTLIDFLNNVAKVAANIEKLPAQRQTMRELH